MKVFVIHYKKLIERVDHILTQFKKHNITDYEFIEIDRDELRGMPLHWFLHNFEKTQIAICLSHFYAYMKIVEKYDYALILEDDAILSEDFSNILDKYMNELPNDYDALFIGNGCNLHIENNLLVPNQHIYERQSSRCTDSYVVSKKGASKLWNYINNLPNQINIAVDHWITIAFVDTNSNVYWAEPTIVTQGTQNGLFNSSHIY